jgi:hypothetical protein
MYKQENQSAKKLESLEQLAKINEPLYLAYLHKESFYEFSIFSPTPVKEAERFLIQWIIEAFRSGLCLQKHPVPYAQDYANVWGLGSMWKPASVCKCSTRLEAAVSRLYG